MKKLLNFLFSRAVIVGIFILLQIAALALMILKFTDKFIYFYEFSILLTFFVTLRIVNRKINPAFKIAMLIPTMIFPIFGGFFYLVFGRSKRSIKEKKRMQSIFHAYENAMAYLESDFLSLKESNPGAALHSYYIVNTSCFPPYNRTQTTFLPTGEALYERMLTQLSTAKKFIFLEYFIIEEGIMWNSIFNILKKKVSEGVDVRLIYDDIGCLFTLPVNFDKIMEKEGIKCCAFNRFKPLLSTRMNNRDHRKICVIDGNIAFTGGINLADEYINAYVKYGHWLDNGIMIRGKAVYSFTVMFLSLWDYIRNETSDYSLYAPDPHLYETIPHDGYVQPYSDTPTDSEILGETVYLNIINRSRKYVYITTPYLIIDNEMVTALCNSAKSGIDVRIITPHIPDKAYVHAVTRSFYPILLEAGVRIYEYTPGFIHSKTFVSDDEYGVVGTINMDFRSLYLHYECAAWMFQSAALADMKRDFLNTLDKCQEIHLDYCNQLSWYRRFINSILRLFSPLM